MMTDHYPNSPRRRHNTSHHNNHKAKFRSGHVHNYAHSHGTNHAHSHVTNHAHSQVTNHALSHVTNHVHSQVTNHAHSHVTNHAHNHVTNHAHSQVTNQGHASHHVHSHHARNHAKSHVHGMRIDSGTAVRNTVKHMVSNLENVITNLHGIVGDLSVLIHQIDVVTDKIDGKYGVTDKIGGKYGATDKIDAGTYGVTDKIDGKYGVTDNIDGKNGGSYWEKSGLNHGKWQMIREKYDSADFSPSIDWSYLGLGECNNNNSMVRDAPTVTDKIGHSRRLRRVKHQLDTSVDSSGVSTDCDLDFDEDFRIHSGSSVGIHKTTRHNFDLDTDLKFDRFEMDAHSSDLDCDMKDIRSSRNSSQVVHVPQHAFCKDVSGSCARGAYCGMYEAIMESRLETLSNCDSNSSFSEYFDDDVISIVDDVPSVTSLDFKADYNRQMNPWTTFGLVHIDSAQESDEVLSESTSDILNDNYIDNNYINSGFEDIQAHITQTIC